MVTRRIVLASLLLVTIAVALASGGISFPKDIADDLKQNEDTDRLLNALNTISPTLWQHFKGSMGYTEAILKQNLGARLIELMSHINNTIKYAAFGAVCQVAEWATTKDLKKLVRKGAVAQLTVSLKEIPEMMVHGGLMCLRSIFKKDSTAIQKAKDAGIDAYLNEISRKAENWTSLKKEISNFQAVKAGISPDKIARMKDLDNKYFKWNQGKKDNWL